MPHFEFYVASLVFLIRADRAREMVVFRLGNEFGPCPFSCKFCGVGNSPKVTAGENRRRFDQLYAEYSPKILERYTAAIFNEGNVTHAKEFSQETLSYVLE